LLGPLVAVITAPVPAREIDVNRRVPHDLEAGVRNVTVEVSNDAAAEFIVTWPSPQGNRI